MTVRSSDADPGRDKRSGYRHPATPYEWSNAVHMRKGKDRMEGPRLPNRLHGTAFALWDRAKMAAGVLTCNPSHAGLAEDLGLSTSGVDRHLNDMENLGWIVRERGGPRRNTSYHLVIPASVHLPVGVPPSVEVPPPADQVHPPVGVGTPTGGCAVPPPVGDEVPSEVPTQVPNEVLPLSYVRNAGADAREDAAPRPTSIYDEKNSPFIPADKVTDRNRYDEWQHLLRRDLVENLEAIAKTIVDEDHVDDLDYAEVSVALLTLFTQSTRPQTKNGFWKWTTDVINNINTYESTIDACLKNLTRRAA